MNLADTINVNYFAAESECDIVSSSVLNGS